jgi:excinuclease UvrABC nuclease subunit
LPLTVELPADAGLQVDLTDLPARPGVFAFENAEGHTLCLATTANVRRLVRERLSPPTQPSRRVHYRQTTRSIHATTVGSAFEADWVYLQQARMRFPQTYAALLERWRAWFVQCDLEATYPRFCKHGLPGKLTDGSLLGPVRDKLAAQRWIELLERLFDLCRYHQVLVQAPHGAACAYKDMGRCPAPCDGTVGMDVYRSQIEQAIDFTSGGHQAWRAGIERDMQHASVRLDFEAAEHHRRRLAQADPAGGPEFQWIDALSNFRWLALMPAERDGWTRVLAICGGWIAPLADLPPNFSSELLQQLASDLERRLLDLSPAGLENIGLVSYHLYQGRSGTFLRVTRGQPLKLPTDLPLADHVALDERTFEI